MSLSGTAVLDTSRGVELGLNRFDDDGGIARRISAVDAHQRPAWRDERGEPRLDARREACLLGPGAQGRPRVAAHSPREAVLAVRALPPERIAEEERHFAESTALNVRMIDPATHESMLRLAEAGLIALPRGELGRSIPLPPFESRLLLASHGEVHQCARRPRAWKQSRSARNPLTLVMNHCCARLDENRFLLTDYRAALHDCR